MAETQTARIYQEIRHQILHGGLSASESLPEAELAATYSVSRNTIKKALMMLESDGLVSIEPNKGAKVRAFSKEEVIEYLEVREILEERLMQITVSLLTDADVARLEEILGQMALAKQENRLTDYSSGNRAFHRVFYDACPNHTLAHTVISMKDQMRKYSGKTVLIPGRTDAGYAEHQAILEAVKARDGIAAGKAIVNHMEGVRKVYDAYFDLLF